MWSGHEPDSKAGVWSTITSSKLHIILQSVQVKDADYEMVKRKEFQGKREVTEITEQGHLENMEKTDERKVIFPLRV